MNKTYFNFLLRSRKTTIIFICVLYALLYATGYMGADTNSYVTALGFSTVTAFILATILVPIMFSYVHNKKAIDSYFSIPISRKEQLVTTLVFIVSLVLLPLFATTIISLITNVLLDKLYLNAYLYYVIIMIVAITTLVIFNTALYLQANSLFDGIVMIGAYLVLPGFLYLCLSIMSEVFVYGFEFVNYSSLFEIISIVYSSICMLSESVSCFINGIFEDANIINFVICILWHLLISFILLKIDYINRKVERAETISNKLTSYPLLICIYTFMMLFINSCMLYENSLEEYLIFLFILFVMFTIANCVYKRKIKIEIKDVIFYVVSCAVTICIGIVALRTYGFGIAKKYEKNPENVGYMMYYSYYDEFYEDNDVVKTVKEKYPDAVYCNVTVSTMISKDQMKSQDKKELYDFMESYREKLIEEYYKENNIINYNCGHVTIENNFDERRYSDTFVSHDILNLDSKAQKYNYSINVGQTLPCLNDLILLNKYCKVYIGFNTEIDYIEISLDDLLK